MPNPGVISRYGAYLNIPEYSNGHLVGRGYTSHPHAAPGGGSGGSFELYVKFEGLKSTGSFKDRGMTAAISEALGRGAKAVICASTGNTAASAAAYAARAGLRSNRADSTREGSRWQAGWRGSLWRAGPAGARFLR